MTDRLRKTLYLLLHEKLDYFDTQIDEIDDDDYICECVEEVISKDYGNECIFKVYNCEHECINLKNCYKDDNIDITNMNITCNLPCEKIISNFIQEL